MLVYRLTAHGAIDNLELVEESPPEPNPDEVVIGLRAWSLNPRDLMVIVGPSPYGERPGLVPVSDGAGDVLAVGADVEGFAPGDRVVAGFRPDWIEDRLLAEMIANDLGGIADGMLAETVARPARSVVRIPDGISYEQAACLPCAGVTAWRALHGGAPLRSDEIVLIQGTGGVSLFALQIAVARGCEAVAVTSSADKSERLRELGASFVVDRSENPDWDEAVLAATGERGVDRIVEVGGAGNLPRSFRAARHGGEIALVGLLDDPMAEISPLPVLSRMLSLRGVSVGSIADLDMLVRFMAGRFEPVIDSVWRFEEAPDALRHLASRRHIGKIVVTR